MRNIYTHYERRPMVLGRFVVNHVTAMAATWYLRQKGIYAKHIAIAWGMLNSMSLHTKTYSLSH